MTSENRLGGIDVLKAVAIVTVIFIHAFNLELSVSSYQYFLRIFATAAAVPSFFFAAGFLASWRSGRLASQMQRIVVPYLVASVFAFAFRVGVNGDTLSFWRIAADVLHGNSFGIYYFVFVLVILNVCGHALEKESRRTRRLALVIAIVAGFLESLAQSMWIIGWGMHSPWRWLGYYLLGSEMAECSKEGSIRTSLVARSAGTASILIFTAGAILGAGPISTFLMHLFGYTLSLAITFGAWNFDSRGWIRWLSESSYTIYLYHMFAVRSVLLLTGGSYEGRATAFVVGVAASVAFTITVRRVLGSRHSRRLFG